jgi:hypothetical protein
MEQYMTNERLKNTLGIDDSQARETYHLSAFVPCRSAIRNASFPRSTENRYSSFRSAAAAKVMRGAFIDQNLRCTPPSAQKNPSAVPGDIPELIPRMNKKTSMAKARPTAELIESSCMTRE